MNGNWADEFRTVKSRIRSERDEFQSVGKSPMPEGLEKELSKQDIADLLVYLPIRINGASREGEVEGSGP